MTPLMHAALYGSASSVGILLKLGADPNLQDKNGMTALMAAAENRHADSAALLLEHGADPGIRDINNRDVLDLECCAFS